MLVTRGHVFDTVGTTVKTSQRDGKGKAVSLMVLLPEEALYMVERGSLQVWVGRKATTDAQKAAGIGAWVPEQYGVGGARELSVMEAFHTFIGSSGLTWDRYQVGVVPRLHDTTDSAVVCLSQASWLRGATNSVCSSRSGHPSIELASPGSFRLPEPSSRLTLQGVEVNNSPYPDVNVESLASPPLCPQSSLHFASSSSYATWLEGHILR